VLHSRRYAVGRFFFVRKKKVLGVINSKQQVNNGCKGLFAVGKKEKGKKKRRKEEKTPNNYTDTAR